MSTYIKLNKQDAYVTSYTAHKAWTVSADGLSHYGIRIYSALSSSGTIYTDETTATVDNQRAELVYKSLHHLYYSDLPLESTSSFERYNQTTLYESSSRQMLQTASLLSIPKDIYGHAIQPGTFRLSSDPQAIGFVSGAFVSGAYIIDKDVTDGFNIYDDGEGVLRDSNNSNNKVGDIIYTHGNLIFTDEETALELTIQQEYSMSFKGSYKVHTHNYRCKVNESQLNYSQNPSIKTGSLGDVYDFVTGSYFHPYITTVGLYNDYNELIAIGKLGQPVPKSKYMDTTFVVKFDI